MRALRSLFQLRLVREATGYAVVGSLAFLLDFGLFAALVSLLTVPYLVAAGISFTVGTTIVYLGVTRYVFSFRRFADSQKEFWIFLVVGIIGLVVNLLAVYFCVESLGLHVLIAKIGAGATTFAANFGLRRLLLFTPKREQLRA